MQAKQTLSYYNQSNLNYFHYKSLEETLYILLFGIPPKNHELCAYKSQIRRFIIADLDAKLFYLEKPTLEGDLISEFKQIGLLIVDDQNITGTYAITRLFIATAYLINRYYSLSIKIPDQKLNLIENFLMMINMDHTQQDLVNAVTQFIIRCMKQELSIISQQPYAMDYPKIIEDVLHQQNICIYDPEFHKYLEINPLRGKIMEMLSLLSRISCRLIIS